MKNMCQSCYMPLDKDPNKGGSEADGTKSTKYCSYCYQNGKFVNEMPLDEFKVFLDGVMKERGLNFLMRKLTIFMLPNLERWKSK